MRLLRRQTQTINLVPNNKYLFPSKTEITMSGIPLVYLEADYSPWVRFTTGTGESRIPTAVALPHSGSAAAQVSLFTLMNILLTHQPEMIHQRTILHSHLQCGNKRRLPDFSFCFAHKVSWMKIHWGLAMSCICQPPGLMQWLLTFCKGYHYRHWNALTIHRKLLRITSVGYGYTSLQPPRLSQHPFLGEKQLRALIQQILIHSGSP